MSADESAPPMREQIIAGANRAMTEIRQLFADAAYWNAHVRKPDELPIDIDPDGALADQLTAMQDIITRELVRSRQLALRARRRRGE